mgnify:FL=1
MKIISVIGHFAHGRNALDGQTVKTKIITEELQRSLGREQVLKIDTHGGWKTLVKAPFQTISALKNSRNILIFPAQNGLRVYAPLLSFFRRFFRGRKLHYVVIGGWLPSFLTERKNLAKALKKFDGIYAETVTMKSALEKQGFQNVFVMPNCKKLTVLAEEDLVFPDKEPLRLCTFSRVMREKGIEDAVRAVTEANKSLGRTAFSLDIYGQVDENQTEWFETLQKTFPDYIRYGGLIPFDKSVETLKEYFALLFPTYYEGECFAGTLIDAYSAGVPVIASDWKYNTELVNENVGYVYKTRDNAALAELLNAMAADPTMILKKKKPCLQEAEKYKIEKAVSVLLDRIEGD